jgi:hypothetical protein
MQLIFICKYASLPRDAAAGTLAAQGIATDLEEK